MTLAEEYKYQNQLRDWKIYLNKLPFRTTDIILDLGCGTGQVSGLFSERCLQVIGVDHNMELLKVAKQNHNVKKVKFLNANLSSLDHAGLPMADGIWCSFTAGYFPDFKSTLSSWLKLLKPGGWIALVEIDHLFGHHPLSRETENIFKAHYKLLLDQRIYDFEMGGKLKNHLAGNGLTITFEQDMKDAELAFDGPADERVILSWENRLNRMTGFKKAVGEYQFLRLKAEFLNCLRNN